MTYSDVWLLKGEHESRGCTHTVAYLLYFMRQQQGVETESRE